MNGTIEKDINIAIVKKLQEVLEGRGVSVILTREDDSGLQDESETTIRKMKVSDMKKRRRIMEKSNADLFLSIHMNSYTNSSAHGLRIFYDSSHPEFEELAKEIQQSISEVTGAETYAVKAADKRLFLMKNPPIPAILVECGFLSNPDEEKKLNDDTYQSQIAWAIAEKLFECYNIR